jgi:hypothetical protein
MMFFTTGNPDNCQGQPGDYGPSMVELNASNLNFVGSWTVPAAQQAIGDADFLATPTIYTAYLNGTPTEMVGAINKNAIYYAFNASKISSGPVWQDQLGPGGSCPQCGQSGLAPSAFDGRVLYIGGPAGTINGKACNGSMQAVNPATGAYLWRDCLGGSVLGGLMATPGLVFANHGGKITAFNDGNGAQLFNFFDSNTASNFWGAPTVADGWLYDGNLDGTFYAFNAPGAGSPTPTPVATPTCPSSPPPPLSLSGLGVNDSANAANWSLQTNIQNGAVQYGDRGYTLTAVPSQLAGAAWIRTANSSKVFTGNPTATFTINEPATVYVAIDNRNTLPSWMSTFTNTGMTLTDNQAAGANTFTLYSWTFGQGTVSLGPNGNAGVNMYTVIVVALGPCGGAPTPTPTATPSAPTPTPTPTSGLQLSNLVVADSANAGNWSLQTNIQNGAVQYGDRGYTLTAVPTTLVGAAWIRTANSSKAFTGTTTVTFTINQAATVYVAIDTRNTVPSWMSTWTNTTMTLTDNQAAGANTFTLYSQSFPAGTVTLGPNDTGSTAVNMYTVIVQ